MNRIITGGESGENETPVLSLRYRSRNRGRRKTAVRAELLGVALTVDAEVSVDRGTQPSPQFETGEPHHESGRWRADSHHSRAGGSIMSTSGIIHVVGARPNFMKVAPVMAALANRTPTPQVLVHTGQHYDANMSDVFFQQLGLPQPDVSLGVGSGHMQCKPRRS